MDHCAEFHFLVWLDIPEYIASIAFKIQHQTIWTGNHKDFQSCDMASTRLTNCLAEHPHLKEIIRSSKEAFSGLGRLRQLVGLWPAVASLSIEYHDHDLFYVIV